jgi:acyl-CoA synthetase (NDP forming)
LGEHGIPVLENGVRAVKALAALNTSPVDDWWRSLTIPVLANVAQEEVAMVSWEDSVEVLDEIPIPVPDWETAITASQAAEAAERIGFPVVLKGMGLHAHKSDLGLVSLNLRSAFDVHREAVAMAESPEAEVRYFLIQAYIHEGAEALLSVVQDPEFGPLICFGAGGTLTDLIEDRHYAQPPFSEVTARDLIERSKMGRILAGHRDAKRLDDRGLVDTIVALSWYAHRAPQTAIEINPLLVREPGAGVLALDAVVSVARTSQR